MAECGQEYERGREEGDTALHVVAKGSYVLDEQSSYCATAAVLLAAGADPNAKDSVRANLAH